MSWTRRRYFVCAALGGGFFRAHNLRGVCQNESQESEEHTFLDKTYNHRLWRWCLRPWAAGCGLDLAPSKVAPEPVTAARWPKPMGVPNVEAGPRQRPQRVPGAP